VLQDGMMISSEDEQPVQRPDQLSVLASKNGAARN
jgi:hypothetical protein